MPHLDRRLEPEAAAAIRARVALDRQADIGEPGREVAAVLDAAQVPAGAVCAGDELALAERLVGDDLALESDRARASRDRPRRRPGSRPRSRGGTGSPSAAASFASSSRSSPRIRASTTVPSSFVTGIAFDVAAGSMPRKPASSSIVVMPGVATSSGLVERLRERRRPRHAARDLEIGGVVAVLAGDERVLAGARRRQVVDRLAAAHHPRLGLHRDRLDPAALEDPVVRALVLLEAHLEAGLVAVERVGVLHDELPHPQQPAPGARLVTALRLEVVERLRQVAVGAELREVERHRLLVRHREDEVAAAAVLQPEELGDPDAPGLLPQLGGREHRHQHLLGADPVHLLPDHLHDLLVVFQPAGQEAPQAGADLADQPGPDEQLVGDRLGVRGVVAQGRQEQL